MLNWMNAFCIITPEEGEGKKEAHFFVKVIDVPLLFLFNAWTINSTGSILLRMLATSVTLSYSQT